MVHVCFSEGFLSFRVLRNYVYESWRLSITTTTTTSTTTDNTVDSQIFLFPRNSIGDMFSQFLKLDAFVFKDRSFLLSFFNL